MKIKKNIIIIFAILLFISGCDRFFGKGNEYAPSITSKDIYTGEEGLYMEFFENAPPAEGFEDSVLPIGMRVYNKGAYDIKGGYLSVSLEKDYMELHEGSLKSINDKFDLSGEHITFDLNGKNIEHPEGEYDVVTLTARIKDLSESDPQSESHTSLISITSCYEYQTKAVETVCIDTDVYGFKKREKPCEVKKDGITLNSQGAPVAVTKIESEMLPDKDNPSIIKPRFMITVKNLGDGEVIKRDKAVVRGACSSEPIGREEWNNVNVMVYLSTMDDENKLDCDITNEQGKDDGIIILKQKEDKVRCVYEKGFDETKGVFSSPLYVILDYGYTDTISREVKIKRVLTH